MKGITDVQFYWYITLKTGPWYIFTSNRDCMTFRSILLTCPFKNHSRNHKFSHKLVCSTWYGCRHLKCVERTSLDLHTYQEACVKKFSSKNTFLHILNVYSHTKSNTPALVWSLQLSNFGLNHVTEHFSVTIDCVRFFIRRFPL